MSTASKEYAAEMKRLHDEKSHFGAGNVTSRHYPFIAEVIRAKKIKSVLDYGCGKGHLLQYLNAEFPELPATGFDIGVEEFQNRPKGSYELVTCFDVLEHVEYGALHNFLADTRNFVDRYYVCSIANYNAKKTLSDGRNAHITQLPFAQWFSILSLYFVVTRYQRTSVGEGIFVCVKGSLNRDWR